MTMSEPFVSIKIPDCSKHVHWSGRDMERITATLDESLVEELDRFQRDRGYQNRSEALRDLIRAGLQGTTEAQESGACVGALVYVYDHEVRALAKRLTTAQHDHHDLSVATMHVHLDHHSCLEVAAQHGDLKARMMIEMDVHGCNRQIVMIVLGCRQPLGKCPDLVVVDIDERPDAGPALMLLRHPLQPRAYQVTP